MKRGRTRQTDTEEQTEVDKDPNKYLFILHSISFMTA